MKRLTCLLLILVVMIGAMALAESDAPIEIATAEQLAAINDNLSGHYVLTADIDLAGIEWLLQTAMTGIFTAFLMFAARCFFQPSAK